MTFKFLDHLTTGKLLAFRTQNWSSFQIPTVYVIISFLKGQKYRVRNYRFVAKLFLWIATTMKMHKAQNLKVVYMCIFFVSMWCIFALPG